MLASNPDEETGEILMSPKKTDENKRVKRNKKITSRE